MTTTFVSPLTEEGGDETKEEKRGRERITKRTFLVRTHTSKNRWLKHLESATLLLCSAENEKN